MFLLVAFSNITFSTSKWGICENMMPFLVIFSQNVEERMGFLFKKTALKSTFVEESYVRQSKFDDFYDFQ